MAFFACAKAARTGTDRATRTSIAKGLVSPTFTTKSGLQGLRGVVQLDLMNGRNMGYVTGQTVQDRLASAIGGRTVKANIARRATAATSPPEGTTQQAALYEGDKGVIKTSTTLGLSKKAVIVGLAGVIVIGFLVTR